MRHSLLRLTSFAVLSLITASACEEDGAAARPGGGSLDPDAGSRDAAPDAADAAPLARVRVVAARTNLAAASGVVVIAHAPDGAPGATATTDASGSATVDVADGGMVTVLTGDATVHRLLTYTGVRDGDVLAVRAHESSQVSMEVGATGFPSLPQGSDNYINAVGQDCLAIRNSTPPATTLVNASSDCLAGPLFAAVAFINYGTESYAVWRRDLSPVTDGGTTTVTGMESFTHLGAQTLPTTFIGRSPGSFVVFGHIANGALFTNTGFKNPPSEQEFVVMPGFADAYQLLYAESTQALPLVRNVRYVKRIPSTATTATVDVTGAMLPAITALAIERTTRPSWTWTSAEPLTSTDGGSVGIEWRDGALDAIWTVVVPPAATAVTAPVLPAAYAAWAPSPTSRFRGAGVAFAESDRITSYGDLRAGVGALQTKPFYLTQPVLPVDGVMRLTSAIRTDF